MKKFKRFWCPSALALALLFIGHAVVASGHGKGRTLIAFKTSTSDPTSSRFFAKIDVSGAVTSNGNPTGNPGTCDNNNHNSNDDSDDDDNNQGNGNHEDSHGAKVGKGHGKGKGQGNGNGNSQGNGNGKGHGHGSNNFNLAGDTVTLTIGSASFTGTADSKGRVSTPFEAKLVADGQILMIEASGLNLVELFPIDISDGSHTVTVPISVSATQTTGTTTTTTALSSQNVTFNYFVKNGRAMGKNF